MLRNFRSAFSRLRLSARASSKIFSKIFNHYSGEFRQRLKYSLSMSEPAYERAIKDKNILLFDFQEEADLFFWEIDTDYRMGASSRALMKMKGNELIFEGELLNLKELDYNGSLYAEIINAAVAVSKFKHFNGMRITIKTDGQPYQLKLVLREPFSVASYTAHIIDKSKKFVTLEIPLHNFLRDFTDPLNPMRLDVSDGKVINVLGIKIGIYSEDQKEGKFSMSLKDIHMIYRQDLEFIAQRYSAPVFFKKCDDYTQVNYIDTGMSLVGIEK
ncbi:unnamed protein product [Blepharisma stoltei]|uniref:NADH:ubiquinone oxidoreductase intermediate-associated protein 30 domain-containing protein n=1 Tax=Blepharisma stoltei TaxID=1481888 RepID=A0AAU9KIC8_9CILI|nr:unnamed protein product [Blepharisma stoltei]